MALENRFLKYVNKTDTCWLWIGYKNNKGYGMISIKNKPYLSHRLSYELFKGNIPDNLFIRHKCDVRNCVNPEHLEYGTNQDNVNDMIERNRNPKGEEKPNAKLTNDDILNIRKLRKEGKLYKEIGNQYNITRHEASRICNFKNWKHIL